MPATRTAALIVPQRYRRYLRSLQRQAQHIWGGVGVIQGVTAYRQFRKELAAYRAVDGSVSDDDLWPCVADKATAAHPIPSHYFHQAAWAARRIATIGPPHHVDIGSDLGLLAVLSAFVPMTFVDVRPLPTGLDDVASLCGSLTALPFLDDSLSSISCLHVIEHVGLGRYRDAVDPRGTEAAAAELARVLAPGGDLLLSTPVGRERTCFNAHRVHAAETIRRYFAALDLKEFSYEDDRGQFVARTSTDQLSNANYSCGCFWFRKPASAVSHAPRTGRPR
jgi:SAM-dependent methyltransferase